MQPWQFTFITLFIKALSHHRGGEVEYTRCHTGAESVSKIYCCSEPQVSSGVWELTGIWAQGESLKHILQQPMNSTLGPCVPRGKLWLGREWRQAVAWLWFTGAPCLPRATNHNIMALEVQSDWRSAPQNERKKGIFLHKVTLQTFVLPWKQLNITLCE